MTRAEALKLAEETVERMLPRKNDRGYDTNVDPQARISALLEIADFLLEQDKPKNVVTSVDGGYSAALRG